MKGNEEMTLDSETHEEDGHFVKMEDIRKSFGDVIALKGVNFEVGENELVGLVGDNGAGKTTLIKILTGILSPDQGSIVYKGEPVKFSSPKESRDLGIEPVHQEGSSIAEMKVWENFFLGREKSRGFNILNKEEMRSTTEETLNKIGINLDSMDRKIGTLSGGERQAVVIGRAVHFGGDLLIMDEPTSGLSLKETQKVLDYVEGVKELGKSLILISHLTRHVYPAAERFVVLDKGEKIGDLEKDEVSKKELEQLIVKGRMSE